MAAPAWQQPRQPVSSLFMSSTDLLILFCTGAALELSLCGNILQQTAMEMITRSRGPSFMWSDAFTYRHNSISQCFCFFVVVDDNDNDDDKSGYLSAAC